MTAKDVYQIAKALPKEEQASLYALIGDDLRVNTKSHLVKPKPQGISKMEARDLLLEKVFKVKLNNS